MAPIILWFQNQPAKNKRGLIISSIGLAAVLGFLFADASIAQKASFGSGESVGQGAASSIAPAFGSEFAAGGAGAGGASGASASGVTAGIDAAGKLFVHVVGAVESPGLYPLGFGSRIADAVAAAGGFSQEAAAHSVNLARLVADGEQIVVLSKAESSGEVQSGGGLVSLNRAGAADLESLPGVGPALSGRILEWRKTNGGFSDKQQLLEVSGIGPKLYSGLVDLVTL